MSWWKVFVKGIWGSRTEEVDQCAARLETCLKELARCNKVFSGWSALGRGKPLLKITRESLIDLLMQGRQWSDDQRILFDDLGYHVKLHAGRTHRDWITLGVDCSVSSSASGMVNTCSLNLPGEVDIGNQVIRWDVLSQAMQCIVRAWGPEWGIVATSDLIAQRRIERLDTPFVGWMVYLAEGRGAIPPLPEHYRVVRIDGFGSIIVTTVETYSESVTEHASAAGRLSAILENAGLLSSIQ